jgi:hypothetical protein
MTSNTDQVKIKVVDAITALQDTATETRMPQY